MPEIQLNLSELCDAYATNDAEIDHYLDVETGDILTRMDPLLTGYRDDELEEALDEGLDERYLKLPQITSREGYELMVEFTRSIASDTLQDRLNTALNGRKPFRTFKDVLYDFPEEREQWFEFEREAHQRSVLYWIQKLDIDVHLNVQQ